MGHKNALAGVVLVAAMIVGLTGCSLFPEPPAELVAAAEEYAEEVRALPGVKTAEAAVETIDAKDRPGDWRVSIVVDATSADDLKSVPNSVAAVRPPSGAELRVTVRIPAAPGLARVVVSDAKAGDVVRAEILRALPVAASVILNGGFSVELIAGTRLADAVSAIRASQVLTSNPFDNVRLSYAEVTVHVSLTGPSDALISLIERLDSDSGVQHVLALEPSPERARPHITVDTDDPERWADALAALSEPSIAERPRTAFLIAGGAESIKGFVGLPLGSAEPDDLPAVEEQAAPVDPAVLAAQLAEDSTSVAEFLTATAESSGIPGAAEVVTTSCADATTPTQVLGTLLLKVFDYANSADPAYEAIVTAWEAQGYAHTDQATGTSIYTPSQARPVVQLSIRGTSEGIQISALGECRG